MHTFEIFGACNIDDDSTCPHCGGWKDEDDDICADCAEDFEDDGDDDGPFEDGDDPDWGEE